MVQSAAMDVAIVEDDDLLRENLRLLLGGEKGISVVGAYGSAEEALAAVAAAPPEILLVDLGLPKMSGIELITEIKSRTPQVEILVHTVFDTRPTVFAAIKAGACGYILKGATPRELIEALFALYEGDAPMAPKIARAVIREFQDKPVEQQQLLLSQRETGVLRNLEEGLTYKEIAERLNISPHTVHAHIKKIYEKLHAKGRQEAILLARRQGIL